MAIDRESLLIGFIAGLVVAGMAGWILGRINMARNGMGAPDRPMNVPTQRTPRFVMSAAAEAARQFLIWSMAMVGFVVLVIGLLYLVLFY